MISVYEYKRRDHDSTTVNAPDANGGHILKRKGELGRSRVQARKQSHSYNCERHVTRSKINLNLTQREICSPLRS